MKINWGTGIVIVIAIFVLGMLSLVLITSMHEVNLVTPDYYPKGIDYQNQMNKKQHTSQLQKGVEFSQDIKNITIKFPSIDSLSKPEGEIWLFFPKNYRMDHKYSITTDENNRQLISKDSLGRGRCTIKVDWSFDGVSYYQEETLMLN